MESDTLIHCQWSHCENEAAKHLVFGVRVFEAPGNIHVSDSSHTVEHLDLCLKHIELICLQYVHVTRYELDSCPKHPLK